jgi:hypothetical protein
VFDDDDGDVINSSTKHAVENSKLRSRFTDQVQQPVGSRLEPNTCEQCSKSTTSEYTPLRRCEAKGVDISDGSNLLQEI